MKNSKNLIPSVAKGIVPGATVATVLSPLALAAPGDLDPGFADLGRLGPILNGPAWTLDPLDDDSFYMAGGDNPYCGWYCYYYYYYYYNPTNFVDLVSGTGAIDPGFVGETVVNTQVLDMARQLDGAIVAVGRRYDWTHSQSQFVAFRLQPTGPLDTTFGTDGIVALSFDDYGTRQSGTSVVLDGVGRIVAAGTVNDRLLVLRLLPDGSIDDSFGTGGFFMGPDNFDYAGARTSLVRTDTGGYRVTATNATGCQIAALTATGALDLAFGSGGVATVAAASGQTTHCSSLVTQVDGRLVAAGGAAGKGFAVRLLDDGQPDPSFSQVAVADALEDATALALDDSGAIVVAGTGVSGASIMRLLANGDIDTLFGNAGSTLIDLDSESGASPIVHDMSVRPDGRVLAAGGDDRSRKAFVVRLLGPGGGDSPGVLSLSQQDQVFTDETANEVVVNVRRTGGSAGSVSVAYETVATAATPGTDFLAVQGRLTWMDGDAAEQQIHVPILADTSPEWPEYFDVALSDAQGGAGLGTRTGSVVINADGSPYGFFGIFPVTGTGIEGSSVRVGVNRDYYKTGEVSVTVTPSSGSATAGDDFTADPITLTWGDGENNTKFADIPIRNDKKREDAESFTVTLSNPTGGAVIAPDSSLTLIIPANDFGKSGGGALGYLSLLFLGLMAFLRSARSVFQSR